MSADAESIDAALATGGLIYLTSSLGDASLGQAIHAASDLPVADRFCPRLVLSGSSEVSDAPAPGGDLVPVNAC